MKPKTLKAILLLRLAVFLCLCLSGFAETTNSFFQFVQDQSQRHYTQVPHEVLAFYYGWYGLSEQRNPWGEANTNMHELERISRYPMKGPYSSHDPEVVDWQIDQAKAHGITGFIVSWWGTSDWDKWHDESLTLLLKRAEQKNFKISIYWEKSDGEGQWQIQQSIQELSYVLEQHAKSSAFLKLNGKPVIFAYGRVIYQVPVASWPAIIEGVRARAGDFVLIADGYQESYACLFDGLHTYDPAGLASDIWNNLNVTNLGGLRVWAAHHYGNGVKIARDRSRISCVMVTPGCDAKKAYKIKEQSDRLDGQTYRTLWDEALKANPDWITITSWNEWPEGTELEPSLEFGDKYLQITAEYAKRFLNRAPVDIPSAAALPKSGPGTTHAVDKILSGRKLAVLVQDRMNDTEFWAAYCGATLQRLTWKDLIDSKYFNASNFPVLIHISTEHYNSSVKVTDDVTWSLVRYLHQGGFLVVVPSSSPWPLNYDDSRKGVPYAITDKLALGVDNGFEQPPAGLALTFYVKTNVLFGLPAIAPFPKTGDLRWRPANRTRVSVSDIYVPLVQLKDNTGKLQGDAVAYIEHRTPSLAGGKSLYVWTRTTEAFGPDNFLLSMYQFISARLKPLPNDK